MSTPSVPSSAPVLKLLTPGHGVLHLYALCLSTAPSWCGVCGRSVREPALVGGIHCERCGTRFHDRCYLKVAGIAERFTLECTDSPCVFICRACRS